MGQISLAAGVPPRKLDPGTHRTEDWVGLITSSDAAGTKTRKISSCGNVAPGHLATVAETPVTLDVLRRSYVFVQQIISISIDLNPFKHDI